MSPLPKYAEVAVGLNLPTTFDYRIPASFAKDVSAGCRVWVPFRQRRLLGIVVGLPSRPQVPRLKAILKLLDPKPLLSEELMALARWVSVRYLARLGQTLHLFIPGPLRKGRDFVASRKEELSFPVEPTAPLAPNPDQQQALSEIHRAIEAGQHQVFLLHGVTGSGKTEVYLQAIESVLKLGKSSIVLVPEIALTPQASQRFQGRFGQTVAVLHSRLLEGTRLKEWQRVRAGQARVVVGTRLAVFAPAENLGLIVVDEEQESSYKQEGAPGYHARDVAIHRGIRNKAPVILGSATPSLESFAQAHPGGYRLLTLPKRIEEVPLPDVQVVDMRQEEGGIRRRGFFSQPLLTAIGETLSQRQQVILFLNRRGFSTFVQCRACGKSLRCDACQVSLTYHQSQKKMICHWCHAKVPPPEICPNCRKEYLRFSGVGTQRVESELARHFPGAKMARLDTDAARLRGSHVQILSAFNNHELDILVGTQMVAKGLDIPKVTLVGVISADTALNLPDFRSAERTFQLLTQVAGRAGRGSLPGRVIVQTYAPHHYATQAASRHDYLAFFRQEIEIRRSLALPPFTHLVQFLIRSPDEKKAYRHAAEVAKFLKRRFLRRAEILGPAPAVIPRLRRSYRWQVLLKTASLEKAQGDLSKAAFKMRAPSGCILTVDVDPL